MSTNGGSPGISNSLNNSANKSAIVHLSNQLEEGETKKLPQQEISASSSSAIALSSSFSTLPSIRENEFLPPISRWTTMAGFLIVATVGIAITLAGLIKYDVTVKAKATVRPFGELKLVQAAREGIVERIWVEDNQSVLKGDVIVTLDDSRLQTQKSQLESQLQQAILQLTQINSQIRWLDTQILAEIERINRSVAAAQVELSLKQRGYQDRQIITLTEVQEANANWKSSQNEIKKAQAELKSAEANLRAVEASLNAAKEKQTRYQKVANAGALSQEQVEEAKITVEQQKQEVEIAKASIEAQKQTIEQLQQSTQASLARLKRTQTALNPPKAEVLIASEQIQQEKATGEVTLANLKKEREALIQQKIALEKQLERDNRQLKQIEIDLHQTTIIATADGIVTNLNLRNSGQNVRSGAEIAQIVPSNASLLIKAEVSPSDIGQLKPNQLVQMRVSACPYPDYGTLKGVVSRISQDTFQSSIKSSLSTFSNFNQKQAFYEVMIKPDNLVLGQGNNQCAIQLGMEGRADIVSRQETFLQFLLRRARLITDL